MTTSIKAKLQNQKEGQTNKNKRIQQTQFQTKFQWTCGFLIVYSLFIYLKHSSLRKNNFISDFNFSGVLKAELGIRIKARG